MDTRRIAIGIIIFGITIFISSSKYKGEKIKITKISVLPSIKELADNEVHKIQQEKIIREYEVEKEKRRKKDIASRGISRSVPNFGTSMKTYMDYRKITNKSSEQYKLQQRDDVYTDNEGFRKIGDRYMVAVGTYYSDTIGDYIKVELSEGGTFEAIVSDVKDNKHTDSTNRQHRIDGSVIEFIVDTKNIDNLCKRMGDMSYSTNTNLMGNIINIEILGNINNN